MVKTPLRRRLLMRNIVRSVRDLLLFFIKNDKKTLCTDEFWCNVFCDVWYNLWAILVINMNNKAHLLVKTYSDTKINWTNVLKAIRKTYFQLKSKVKSQMKRGLKAA